MGNMEAEGSPGVAAASSHRRRSLVTAGSLAAFVLVAVGVSLATKGEASGAAYVPAADSAVLEHLPSRVSDPKSRELRELRGELGRDPRNVALAVRVARLDIEEARATSDPRYLGYAQAALAPWWDEPSPPAPVLLLRATIRQSVHDFDAALADLDGLVQVTPDDPQAWLTRSVVLGVRGRYDEARASCAPLAGRTSPLVLGVCMASLDSLTGQAAAAYGRLALAAQTSRDPGERSWATSTLGEIASRLGDTAKAERHFKEALAADPDDAYVLGAYADLLLDAGRPADAAALVKDRTVNDALLLRLALAETAMRAAGAAAHTALLKDRFDASHLRGDSVHRREEARFALGLLGDAGRALDLAKANWEVQKEPWDIRVLLESSLAARDAAAAKPALDFLDAHRLEDPTIRRLAAEVRGGQAR